MANFENMNKTFNIKLEETTFLKGDPGEDGFSPVISVSNIPDGHRITIVDANGTNTIDVMNGDDVNAQKQIDALSEKDAELQDQMDKTSTELQEQIDEINTILNDSIAEIDTLIGGGE